MSSPDNKAIGFQKQIDKDFGTKVCHFSQEPEQWATMDVVPPISMASTFKLKEPIVSKYFYSRVGNPSRDILEKVLASIENAKYGLCYSSGLGALTAVFSILKSGDHVLCVDEIYGGSYSFFSNIAANFNIEASYVNADSPLEFVNAMKPNTKLIWLESPTNPTLKVWNVEEICKLAKIRSRNVIIALDNSFLTPYFQKPLELGCDIAFYSASKYLNGHSDVIMGSVALNDDQLYERLHNNQSLTGIIPSPMSCFLVNRGLKTLHLRMEQHMRNGLAVGRFLERHPAVLKVLHPGLTSHPHHDLALKQWSGCSGIVSFYHRYGLEESKIFLKNLKLFSLAVSLGGYESLAQLPCTMTHASVPREEREKIHITDNLIRLSVGIESADDIINDLDQALSSLIRKEKTTKILIHG